jgi:hypothetical protein
MLSEVEEKCIILTIVKRRDWGFPLRIMDVRMFVKRYLDAKYEFVRLLTTTYLSSFYVKEAQMPGMSKIECHHQANEDMPVTRSN